MSSPIPTTSSFFQHHVPVDGVYDELLTPSGKVRPHVQQFVKRMNRIGPEEFRRRWAQSQRVVRENGFAYGGHATPKNKPRPWELDPIPLVLGATEWNAVTAALSQRAMVLDLVLQDLFGPQNLLKEGVLPPELVFRHPGFLRPYHGQTPPGGRLLNFYAADLGRAPDGRWWVLADRTEAPSGLGYALENRIVCSRMLPDTFRGCHVQRLAPFFVAMQETLQRLAARHRENPHIVLLSHGPMSPNYFEDAYLARYLGYTLVEGGDLTVRDGHVRLKTLAGLSPIDVILRRQNSEDCDPLELGSHSPVGVAGLMHSVRQNQVATANVLGSGLVESAAFMSFMPKLCRSLLGEDLKIPGVASWWCGQPDALQYVLQHLDDLIVQPAFRRRGKDGPTRETLSRIPRSQLEERIRAEPHAYAAQERVTRSTVPAWEDLPQSAHIALRAYVIQTADSYLTMNGALARISDSLEPLETSIRKGEGSKDTWILADGPVEHVTLLNETGQTIDLRRSGADLPSRVADNVLWLGRQFERADAVSRILRSTVRRMTGETRWDDHTLIPRLLRCLADSGQIEPGYAVATLRNTLPPIETALPTSVLDAQLPGSLRNILDDFVRLGSVLRDRMSRDTWRIIRRIDKGFEPPPTSTPDMTDILALTDDLIIDLAAFDGMVTRTMTRGQAYRFMEIGRRLERSLQILTLVKNCLLPPSEPQGSMLETMLEISDSLMTYRSRYLARLQLAAVLDLLLTDESTPRSLAYQLARISEHVDQLPRQSTSPGYSAEQRIAMTMLHSVRMADIQGLAESHQLHGRGLETLIQEFEHQLPLLSEAISHRYLVHSGPSSQLAEIVPQ